MGDKLEEAVETVGSMSIADILGNMYGLAFQPEGSIMIGPCPMHDDFPNSLVIDPLDNSYSCEICEQSGDAVTYVARYEGLDDLEALAKICENLGVSYLEGGAERQRETRFTIYDAYERATAFYQQQLLTSEGKWALDYLKGRMSEDSIARFRVGYASFGGLYKHLRFRQGVSIELLLESKLVVPKKDHSGHRDFFINRIMFPMIDVNHRPIAFVGRAEDGTKWSKYMNSKESPLFNKSEVLFGINLAHGPIRRSKKALIVEGPTDVIANHECGIEYAVGTVGTAITEFHIDSVSKLAKRVLIASDDDEAGRKAALRAGEVALDRGVNLGFLKLDGKDPFEIIKDDLGAYLEKLEDPLTLIQFAFLNSGIQDIKDPDEIYRIISQDLFSLVDKQRNHVQKNLSLRHIAESLGMNPRIFYNGYNQHLVPKRKGRPNEDFVIGYAAANPSKRRKLETTFRTDDFSTPIKKRAWNYLTKSSERDGAMIRPDFHTGWGDIFSNGDLIVDFKRYCENRGIVVHEGELNDLEGILIRTKNTNSDCVNRMRIEVLEKEMQELEWKINETSEIDELMRRYNAKYDEWMELKGDNNR